MQLPICYAVYLSIQVQQEGVENKPFLFMRNDLSAVLLPTTFHLIAYKKAA